MTTTTTKPGPGRPSLKSPAVCEEICTRIASGEPLTSICGDDHMPAWQTVYDWMNADPAFSVAIARARDLGADAIAEEALAIIDRAPERIITQTGEDSKETRIDGASVQWAKNRAEFRLKLLAKWNPKKYGDKIDVTSNGETLGLAEKLAKARRRADEERE